MLLRQQICLSLELPLSDTRLPRRNSTVFRRLQALLALSVCVTQIKDILTRLDCLASTVFKRGQQSLELPTFEAVDALVV